MIFAHCFPTNTLQAIEATVNFNFKSVCGQDLSHKEQDWLLNIDYCRGRGRGKASLSFDISHLGFNSGQSLPRVALEPPPLYPPLQQCPTPLSATEVDEYLLALSQEFRGSIRVSPFYLKANAAKRDIVRYTDRYKENQKTEEKEWQPDWKYLPTELRPVRKRKVTTKGNAKANVPKTKTNSVKPEDISKQLETLEAKETEEVKKVEGDDDDDENEDIVEELEDEFEDDNDYNFDYYNDGGDKYGDDDDGEEGPVY